MGPRSMEPRNKKKGKESERRKIKRRKRMVVTKEMERFKRYGQEGRREKKEGV